MATFANFGHFLREGVRHLSNPEENLRSFENFLNRLSRYDVLVLDELGYNSYSTKSADILFEVIARRYEKKATIITTNKSFGEWGNVFPGAGCVSALIDRLTHRADLIVIKGKSFRKKESDERQNRSHQKTRQMKQRRKQK